MPSCLGTFGSVRIRQNIQSAKLAPEVSDLRAVDHVVVAVFDGARLQAGQVRTGAGFAVALAPPDFAAHDLRQVLVLLLLGSRTPRGPGRSWTGHAGVGGARRGCGAFLRLARQPALCPSHRRRIRSATSAPSSLSPPCDPATASLPDLDRWRADHRRCHRWGQRGHGCSAGSSPPASRVLPRENSSKLLRARPSRAGRPSFGVG